MVYINSTLFCMVQLLSLVNNNKFKRVKNIYICKMRIFGSYNSFQIDVFVKIKKKCCDLQSKMLVCLVWARLCTLISYRVIPYLRKLLNCNCERWRPHVIKQQVPDTCCKRLQKQGIGTLHIIKPPIFCCFSQNRVRVKRVCWRCLKKLIL